MEAIQLEIQEFALKHLMDYLKHLEVDVSKLDYSDNLLELGWIDSMGFLELIAAIETQFDLNVDFSDIDPSEFTTLNGLVAQCVKLKVKGLSL